MTVSSVTNRKTFAGNGVTTSFATSPVVFFDTSDLVLTAVTDSTGASEALVENTDYTVSGGAGATGTVSLAGGSSPYGAPAAGITLVIRRVLPLTQDDDFLNNDINDAEVLEDRLDRLTMIDQQIDEEIGRSLKVPSSEGEQTDITVTGKAGYYLRRNVAGNAFELAVGDANTSTFTQSGTGAVERSVTAKLGESVSVKDFGAVGDGVTDDTAAIQRTISAVEASTATKGLIYFPPGTYLVSSEIRISNDRINLRGDGPQSSTIDFRPSGEATCVRFQKATATQLVQSSIKGIGFISGGGNTQTKTALNVVDVNLFVCEDFAVNSWAGSSIGIKTNGRDASYFSRIAINCLRPLLISTNPNYAPIDIDHFEFNDVYLITTAKAVEIESGVDLSNVKFSGTQAWVGGTHGLYWVSTAATGISYPLSIENLRTEQGNAGYWPIYIDLSAAQLLRSFALSDSYLGNENGIYLRNVSNISLRNISSGGGAGKTALDITAQARSLLVCENVQIQDLATVTLTTFTRLFESMPTSTNSPLGEYAVYCYNGNSPLMRHALVVSADLPAPLTGRSGGLILEDAGRGHIELVAYGSNERHRISRAITKRVEHFDDFLGDFLADEWGSQIGSDPQVVAPAVVIATHGTMRMTTGDDAAGTMATNGVQLHSQLTWRPAQGGFACEFRLQISAITNVAVFVGMTDQIAALEFPIESAASADTINTNASNAFGVMFDTSMSTDNWWAVGVATDVDAVQQNMGVAPAAATYETWRIEVDDGTGAATFYRNGVLVGVTVAGAVTPNTPMTPVVAAISRSTATRNVTVDYVYVHQNRLT